MSPDIKIESKTREIVATIVLDVDGADDMHSQIGGGYAFAPQTVGVSAAWEQQTRAWSLVGVVMRGPRRTVRGELGGQRGVIDYATAFDPDPYSSMPGWLADAVRDQLAQLAADTLPTPGEQRQIEADDEPLQPPEHCTASYAGAVCRLDWGHRGDHESAPNERNWTLSWAQRQSGSTS